VPCKPFHLQFSRGTSVQIRFGERERISDQFDARFPIIHDNDLHDIKSKKNIRIVEHSQPSERAARNSLPFFSINRFHGPAEIFATPGFHFDKYKGVIVTTDDIDLAATASTEIAEENFVAVTPEIPAR
jgi:hypothetical protein